MRPFRTVPRFDRRAWGSGRRLEARFGLAVPEGTSEVWLASGLTTAPSLVRDGPFAGWPLCDLVAARGDDLLGRGAAGPFPLLVKLLDVEGRLSVQVHPDAEAARALGDGERGKSEAWLVLERGPEAEVALGVRERLVPADLRRGVGLLERLAAFRPDVDEGITVPARRIHTAHDVVVLEVQEPCDVTYRVHSWDPAATLHLAQAERCAWLEPEPPRRLPARRGAGRLQVASGDDVPFGFDALTLPAGGRTPLGPCGPAVVVALEGTLLLDDGADPPLRVEPGEAAVVPACARDVSLLAPRGAWCALASGRGTR